jgi:hypothetical protein
MEALRQLLCGLDPASADRQPDVPLPREVLLCDSDFSDWPLDEPAVQRCLAAWLRPAGRCLRIVGVDFEKTARLHPKFARWRRDWSHRIEVWQPVDGRFESGLRLLLAGPVVALWLDGSDPRLTLITDSVRTVALREQCADFLQRCEPAWPVTTIGL